METAKVTIHGRMPLLMHADNIDWADAMEDWKNDPENKRKSKPGDDRTPPWRWIGYLNFDDPKTGVVTIPSEYIMRSIMGGAAEVLTGKGKKTYKAQSQSGLLCSDFHWPLRVNGTGATVAMADVQKFRELKTFSEQKEYADQLGFSLFVKRVVIGQSKHIRVRPRFEQWSVSGEILILDEAISLNVLNQILTIAGKTKGLGSWRPGGRTPGPFGTFTVEVS